MIIDVNAQQIFSPALVTTSLRSKSSNPMVLKHQQASQSPGGLLRTGISREFSHAAAAAATA